MIVEAEGNGVHQRSSALLRRWLAETHTPVPEGALRLAIGPVRLRTEVVHRSPTGQHGFGPIRVLDADGAEVVEAEPVLLAAACSADARARATADAPLNAPGAPTLVDWAVDSVLRRESDPLPPPGELAALARSLSSADEARRWLSGHVESRLLPGLRAATNAEAATEALLSRGALPVIGGLGRRGVADERELLAGLVRGLHAVVEGYPETKWLVDHWLTSPTLTDAAALNGGAVRYERTAEGAVRVRPMPFERANPLRVEEPEVEMPVPVPELGGGFRLRPVRLDPDAELVHRWMNAEHVAVNWKQAWPLERWRQELADQLGGDHSLPCVVSRDGRDLGYLELYRVRRDKLAHCYSGGDRDLGVHIAIGEPDAIGRGVGSGLLRAVAEGLLAADPACARVVAEPDVHNGASVAAFGKAGFVRSREVGLPGKNSALMVFARG
ncbi:GNAT family N-acetyltransferase [Saccharopolyspora sp. CA-218241]|uniref:GNAT family N-acetyltransferase n=1 Tax=Saccharopolyspora sp. CA-218241 TaxID=3240027 RepID=UPI003D9753E4